MDDKLRSHGINLPGNAIKIWVKEFVRDDFKQLYPKIEFDSGDQELQYDMSEDGAIKEIHFKSFEKNGNGYKRVDIPKEHADVLLAAIDNIIRDLI